jgi:hypothetical protein
MENHGFLTTKKPKNNTSQKNKHSKAVALTG